MNYPYQRDLLYVHLNNRDQYVLSSGIKFSEFVRSLHESIQNILLLQHQSEEGYFNSHTLLHYVPNDRIGKLMDEPVSQFGKFCWLDFEEIEGLNLLSPRELSEILYLGHVKHHLKLPFYNQLENRFAYLAQDDGWFNKTYYRNIGDFYRMLGFVIPEKISVLKPEKNLFGFKKKRAYPQIGTELLTALNPAIQEGAVFSINRLSQNRSRVEIPIWVIGDFANMDEMYEEYTSVNQQPPAAMLTFDKKQREWELY